MLLVAEDDENFLGALRVVSGVRFPWPEHPTVLGDAPQSKSGIDDLRHGGDERASVTGRTTVKRAP